MLENVGECLAYLQAQSRARPGPAKGWPWTQARSIQGWALTSLPKFRAGRVQPEPGPVPRIDRPSKQPSPSFQKEGEKREKFPTTLAMEIYILLMATMYTVNLVKLLSFLLQWRGAVYCQSTHSSSNPIDVVVAVVAVDSSHLTNYILGFMLSGTFCQILKSHSLHRQQALQLKTYGNGSRIFFGSSTSESAPVQSTCSAHHARAKQLFVCQPGSEAAVPANAGGGQRWSLLCWCIPLH